MMKPLVVRFELAVVVSILIASTSTAFTPLIGQRHTHANHVLFVRNPFRTEQQSSSSTATTRGRRAAGTAVEEKTTTKTSTFADALNRAKISVSSPFTSTSSSSGVENSETISTKGMPDLVAWMNKPSTTVDADSIRENSRTALAKNIDMDVDIEQTATLSSAALFAIVAAFIGGSAVALDQIGLR